MGEEKSFFERLREFEAKHPFTGPGTRTLKAASDGTIYVADEMLVPDVRDVLRRQGQVRQLFSDAAGELRLEGFANGSLAVQDVPPLVQAFHVDALAQLRTRLAEHPEERYSIDDRRFEELVAYLLETEGYTVELTRKTRDGGKDLVASIALPTGTLVVAVECKRYGRQRKVDVDRVRSLHGVVASGFTQGMLVTTSDYTLPARQWAAPHQRILTLQDGEDLMRLIRNRA